MITGRAWYRAIAVVKVAYQINEDTQFSESGHQKTMKYGTIDYVCEGNLQTTFDNRITGASPHMGEILRSGVLRIT